MAFTITTKEIVTPSPYNFVQEEKKILINYTWNVGQSKPKFPNTRMDKPIIKMFQADGDELEIIKKHFVNVPHCHAITTWRGSMAQFIYDNL